MHSNRSKNDGKRCEGATKGVKISRGARRDETVTIFVTLVITISITFGWGWGGGRAKNYELITFGGGGGGGVRDRRFPNYVICERSLTKTEDDSSKKILKSFRQKNPKILPANLMLNFPKN